MDSKHGLDKIAMPSRLRLLSALGGGLYLARLAVEFGPLAWPWWGIALLAAILAILAVAARRAERFLDLRPLLAAWVYVVYPALDLRLAAGVGFAALAGAIISNLNRARPAAQERHWPRLTLPVLVFVLALTLYVATLAPGLLAADNAEYQLVAHHLGVAHPPGYALYTMLGKLFTLLPLGNPAWRVNLFAALTGALTLALIARIAQRLSASAWGGAAAALALGVAPTFWAQSTTANIRSLTVLFTVWCFDALLAFGDARRQGEMGRRELTCFTLGLGLGIGHHLSLAFLLPAFGLYLLAVDPTLIRQPRRWLRPGLIFAATFIVLAYFPLRGAAGAVLAPDHLTTLDGFLEHVLARGFGGDMFAFLSWGLLPHRFAVLGDILLLQFGGPLLIAAGLGALALLWRERRAFLLLGLGFALFFFLVATYRAPQTVEYLMPAYAPLAVAAGYAAGIAARWRRWRFVGAWLAALILLPGFVHLAAHYPSFADLHHDSSARDYAEPILRHAPPDALILSNWHWWTTFRYLQLSEGLRPDVELVYVYPQGESYAANWVERIETAAAGRPLIVTDWYREYESLPHSFVPFDQAFLVRRESLLEQPPGLTPLDAALEDAVQLAGYHLSDNTLTPGQPLTVHLAWRPLSEWERDYSFFVQLLGPGGLAGQGQDAIHHAGRYQAGEVVIDRFEMAVWPTVLPGEYALVAGVYFTPEGGGWQRLIAPDGSDHVSLGTVRLKAPASPPVTLHPLRCRFENGLTLIGTDFDHSPGQPRRVYLHWRLPLETGEGYSVQLLVNGGLASQTHLPALPDGGYLSTAHDVPDGPLAVTVEPGARWIGAWGILSSAPFSLPSPSPGDRFVPLGGEMTLTGVEMRRDIRLSEEERALLGVSPGSGEILQIDLRWLSLRPLTRDRKVAVQALAWGANHDSVPALGAIPTLKWIRGTRVRDRHFLLLPEGAGGEAALQLDVYDHFTQQRSLALLDERLAKLGSMTPLGKIPHEK